MLRGPLSGAGLAPLGLSARPVIPASVLYTLPGLYAAFDASSGTYSDAALTTPTTEGGLVRGWADLSGNGRKLRDTEPLYGATNSPPVWSATSFPGGKPGLTFDGTDTALGANDQWTVADSITVYMVASCPAWASSDLQYLGLLDFAANSGILLRVNQPGNLSAFGAGYAATVPSVINATGPANGPALITWQLGTTSLIRVNGASAGGTVTNGTLPSKTYWWLTGIKLSVHSLLNGVLAAMWIYVGTPHSTLEIEAAEAQLMTDWGL